MSSDSRSGYSSDEYLNGALALINQLAQISSAGGCNLPRRKLGSRTSTSHQASSDTYQVNTPPPLCTSWN